MQEFSLQHRVGLLLGVVFIYIPLIVGGGWLSVYTFDKYLSFPPELTYTSFIVYGFSAVLILTPVAFISMWPIFRGQRVSSETQKCLSKYVVIAFVVTLASQMGFKIYFTNQLAKKGYIACPEMPKSWVSGMATRYVRAPQRCGQ